MTEKTKAAAETKAEEEEEEEPEGQWVLFLGLEKEPHEIGKLEWMHWFYFDRLSSAQNKAYKDEK